MAEAAESARQALAHDDGCAPAWRLLGLALEGEASLIEALGAYERALGLSPDSPDILADLGRLAMTLDLGEVAVQFFARARAANAGSDELSEQLAAALRKGHHYAQAIAVLSAAVEQDSADPLLWNALGSVYLQQGDADAAFASFDRAVALAPGQAEGFYNRATAQLDRSDFSQAIADCDAALDRARADQAPAIRYVRALARLSSGALAPGWADYEARFDPDFAGAPVFSVPLPRWSPEVPLSGRGVLVVAEQGLGDEMMFAGLVPDALAAAGPQGRLGLAVAPRLVALFARSFPQTEVVAHVTDASDGRKVRSVERLPEGMDLWAPIGSLSIPFRSDLHAFERSGAALKPDPARVEHWRRLLGEGDDRPKVGVIWKSSKTHGDRRRQFAPFEAWEGLLRTPGVRFVNLQYGDCAAEIAQARSWGTELWTAPDLDLTNDLDDAAALSASLGLVIGFPNASTSLAAACGARTWIVTPDASWWRFGTEGHGFFPQARVFLAPRDGDWRDVMGDVARALRSDLASSSAP